MIDDYTPDRTGWARFSNDRKLRYRLGRMRALTLTQPWAGLVASGIKLVENRARLEGRRKR